MPPITNWEQFQVGAFDTKRQWKSILTEEKRVQIFSQFSTTQCIQNDLGKANS